MVLVSGFQFRRKGVVGFVGLGPEVFAEVFVGGVAEDGDDDGLATGVGIALGDFEGRRDGGGERRR